MCTNKVCNVITVYVKREKYRPSWAVDLKKKIYIMFALMREYISTYFYTVYDVMATNINVVL